MNSFITHITGKLKCHCAIALLILTSMCVKAQQEPMFTQYMFNETFINPAYVGSHEGLAMNMVYRNQWAGIKGSPKTQAFSIHLPVENRKLGIGLSMMNESIGVSNKFLICGNFAYRILMPSSVLAFGLQGGIVNDVENFTDVNTTTPGDRQFSSDVRKYFLPNAGFGTYYYKKNFYAGFSIPRLLENKIDPSKPNSVVKNIGNPKVWSYYFATGYVMDLDENVKFKPSVMIKCVQNAPVQLDASLNFVLNDLLWLGTAYRTGDAVSCLIGFQISREFRFGYSYDYTISHLQKYSYGSHEFTISYDIGIYKTRIKSIRYF